MNKLIFVIPIISGAAIAILLSLIFISGDSFTSESKLVYDVEDGFTYHDIQVIQATLAAQNITVTTPVAVTDNTINQYCIYFENGRARTVDYCTTTNVLDSKGDALGNINMGGNTNYPVLAIANLETATLESNQDQVLAVFETVIKTLVCDCWEEKKSNDNVESIAAWVKAVHGFYHDSNQRNIKSMVDDLEDVQITLEITSKGDDSVLQTLIVLK